MEASKGDIFNPHTVHFVDVHDVHVGGPSMHLDASTVVYLHHYKNPEQGPMYAKDPALQIKDDSLYLQFRDKVMEKVTVKSTGVVYSNN